MEKLFKQMVLSDLHKMNELVRKGWFGTTDFNEAVLNLSNSLSAYHQEVTNEGNTEGECLPQSQLAKGA